MNYKDSFHPYAWVSIFFWSLTAVLTRLALQYFSAFSLGFLRYLIASGVLLAVAALYKMKPPRPRDLPWFLASGGTGFFLYMITYNQGQAVVTAATGSVVIAMAPVLTALLTRLIYREKIRPYQWAAIFIEFAGVAVLTLMNSVFSVNRGLFWLFFAALSLSVYNLIQRKLTKTYDSLQ
ncbi:MAG: DMT family transporter, partial [Oscillibacter sp.]|nr:DMT family transporter [Oscillibacter sp.]